MRKTTKIKDITDEMARSIANGSYPENSKLPSIRELACNAKISKTSAVEIYEKLIASEFVEVRGTRGFFVKQRSKGVVGSSQSEQQLCDNLRNQYRGRFPVEGYHPCGGWLGKHVLPTEAFRFALREASRAKTPQLFSYDDVRGYAPLRRLLVDRLNTIGISSSWENMLLVDSASMAIDLICRLMLSPGDTVLVDDPTSLDFISLSKLHRVKVKGVPMKEGRRDINKLEELINKFRPQLYIICPIIHNPTGAILSGDEAFEILSLARASNMYLVEDDVYSDLLEAPAPRLSGLSGHRGVAYVSSFSKTISPSLRCGFVSAEPEIAARLANLATISSFGTNTLTSIVVHKLLNNGAYRRGMKNLRKFVSIDRKEAIEKLHNLGFHTPPPCDYGVYLWVKWRGNSSAERLFEVASSHGVVLAPGSSFSPSGNFSQHIRFNCTLMKGDDLFEKLKCIVSEAEERCHVV